MWNAGAGFGIKIFRLELDKLDTIEKRLDSVIASISSIEETVGRLDKDVVILKNKTSETETRVNELEEGARFNETELSDIKRDTKKAQFDTEELRKQLLYLEAYSRRENLKFAGIPENVPEGQQMENTKINLKLCTRIIYLSYIIHILFMCCLLVIQILIAAWYTCLMNGTIIL